MQIPAPRYRYRVAPYGRRRPLRLLWLIWGIATLGMIIVGSFVLLGRIEIASHHDYVGELRPNANLISVSLPDGAVVEKIVVERNQKIRKGQTLAVFDVKAMKQFLSQTEIALARQVLLRSCLLSGPRWLTQSRRMPPGAEIGAALELATTECKSWLDRKVQLNHVLDKKTGLLSERISLIEKYIRALTNEIDGEATGTTDRGDKARDALALSLTKNLLQDQIAELDQEYQNDLSAYSTEKLEKLRQISQDIVESRVRKRNLLDRLENPRLLAEQSGRVVSVRPLRKQTLAEEAGEIMEIRPPVVAGFEAKFHVPQSRLGGVELGNEISLKLVGHIKFSEVLTGSISRFEKIGGQIHAVVELDAHSVSLIDDPRNGIALRGQGTASIVTVKRNDFKAVEAMQGVVMHLQLVPNWLGEYWQRVKEFRRVWINTDAIFSQSS